MRPFKIYKGHIVRISNKVDKITMLDWFLHLFGIHLIRTSSKNVIYCRLCSNMREVSNGN